MSNYDILVIGGGPGGYVAAIRAAQLGKKTAVIESTHLGGVCLNWGCIPTKALLRNAEVLSTIKNAKKFGIDVPEYNINWQKVVKRSRNVAKRLSRGIEFLFKKNKIDLIKARGKLIDAHQIETETDAGEINHVTAEKIIVATGAHSKWFPGMEPDRKLVITSKEALVLEELPESIVIIGAGAIGVEFAHLYSTFGSKVTIIEALPHLLPIEDEDISSELEKIFKRRRIKIHTNTMVAGIDRLADKVIVKLNNGEAVESQKALVAVGVQPNLENIGLEEVGIISENDWIKTNGFMQTNIPNIYAIGDVAGPPLLAHKASAEGVIAAEYLSGLNPSKMKYNNIPGCTYCQPEVASVGLTEKAARAAGYELKIGTFPFRALGKAVAADETEGFAKVIYNAKNNKIIGCHLIGHGATNLITETALACELNASHLDILKTIHPHPTLSEAIMEATGAAFGEAIHI